jgi:hypothetical protein
MPLRPDTSQAYAPGLQPSVGSLTAAKSPMACSTHAAIAVLSRLRHRLFLDNTACLVVICRYYMLYRLQLELRMCHLRHMHAHGSAQCIMHCCRVQPFQHSNAARPFSWRTIRKAHARVCTSASVPDSLRPRPQRRDRAHRASLRRPSARTRCAAGSAAPRSQPSQRSTKRWPARRRSWRLRRRKRGRRRSSGRQVAAACAATALTPHPELSCNRARLAGDSSCVVLLHG